jgi:hypothetical protein
MCVTVTGDVPCAARFPERRGKVAQKAYIIGIHVLVFGAFLLLCWSFRQQAVLSELPLVMFALYREALF